jgi:hypothetical protein
MSMGTEWDKFASAPAKRPLAPVGPDIVAQHKRKSDKPLLYNIYLSDLFFNHRGVKNKPRYG